MRVYLPATFGMLAGLNETGTLTARSGWGFAVTPALVEFYTAGDEEEIAHAAFLDAAEASVRLTPPQVSVDDLAAIHIDIEESETATRAAVEVVDEADLGDEGAELTVGDAQDNFMAFYDPTELPFLIELL